MAFIYSIYGIDGQLQSKEVIKQLGSDSLIRPEMTTMSLMVRS